MKISARNVLKGKVTKVVEGVVNCEVTLEIAPSVEIVSIITKSCSRVTRFGGGQDCFGSHQGIQRNGRR